MAEWHLTELKTALADHGWSVAVEAGDHIRVSESWRLSDGQRGARLCIGPPPQHWAGLEGVPGAAIHFPHSRTVYRRLVDVLLTELSCLPDSARAPEHQVA